MKLTNLQLWHWLRKPGYQIRLYSENKVIKFANTKGTLMGCV